MKFFITGLHASGKQEVVNYLTELGVKCGKNFTNLETPSDQIYNSKNMEYYSVEDINNIFENEAYIFLQELQLPALNFNAYRCYEGLSSYTFDQNEVFILSPDQLLAISPSAINEEICFIWMDNTKDNRSSRYYEEKRSYSYNERDAYERRDLGAYVKALYSFSKSNVIYFNDEVPERVATIVYTLVKHPELLDLYIKNFD
jgi:hypothetical protein